MSNQGTLEKLEGAVKEAKKAHKASGSAKDLGVLQKAQGDLVLYFKGEQIIDDNPSLRNLTVVTEYLSYSGWKVSRSSVATHNKEGAISPDSEGFYPLRRVLAYAERFPLDRKDGGTFEGSGADRKAKAEAERIEASTIHTRAKTAILEKEWVSREKVERENWAKSTLFKNDFKNLCQTRGPDLAHEFSIPEAEHGNFIARLNEELEKALNTYSDDREFWIEVLADD